MNIDHSTKTGKLLRLPLKLIPAGLPVPILSGTSRGLKWVTGSSPHGCWLGVYERGIQAVIDRYTHRGDVFYDIGANVGFFSLMTSRLVGVDGQVFAFEPLPRNLVRLKQHVALNRLHNVQVMEIAVADETGTARFRDAGCSAMAGLSKAGDIEVRVDSVDALVEQKTLAPPTVIKIDVEGAEDQVLQGAAKTLKTHRPTIILSSHGSFKRRQCIDLLTGFGYRMMPLRNGAGDGNYEDVVLPA